MGPEQKLGSSNITISWEVWPMFWKFSYLIFILVLLSNTEQQNNVEICHHYIQEAIAYEVIKGIDTNIEVIVVLLTAWEAHHSPRAKPGGCGELLGLLMRQQWPKLRYQFLFYHDETKLMMNKQIPSIQMLKFVPKLSLVTVWLHVHILGSCDLIVSPWEHV